jgi:methionyl aminopeptidase
MWSDVAQAMDDFVRAAGYTTVESMCGHGVGKEMHEEPQVPHYVSDDFKQKNDFPLKPGLVLAIEPMVNQGRKDVKVEPDQWTHSTADGRLSAHFEHTVAVTRTGSRVLTAPPQNEEEREFLRSLDRQPVAASA